VSLLFPSFPIRGIKSSPRMILLFGLLFRRTASSPLLDGRALLPFSSGRESFSLFFLGVRPLPPSFTRKGGSPLSAPKIFVSSFFFLLVGCPHKAPLSPLSPFFYGSCASFYYGVLSFPFQDLGESPRVFVSPPFFL